MINRTIDSIGEYTIFQGPESRLWKLLILECKSFCQVNLSVQFIVDW